MKKSDLSDAHKIVARWPKWKRDAADKILKPTNPPPQPENPMNELLLSLSCDEAEQLRQCIKVTLGFPCEEEQCEMLLDLDHRIAEALKDPTHYL